MPHDWSPLPEPDHTLAATTTEPATTGGSTLVITILCFGAMSAALTQTLVIPIQSELPRLLGTTASNASWVVTATLLAGAVATPIAGRVADLVGKPRVLVASAAILVAGSFVCAIADTLTPMLIGRALQGMSMGYIPVAISLVREVVPPRRATTAIATLSATLGVGGAIGLPLSAWMSQQFDWHLLFWMSTVLGLVMVVTTRLGVPPVRDARGGRFDLVGAAGFVLGLVAALVGVSKSTDWGWTNPTTLAAILGGAVLLVGWGRYELTRRDPLVDVRATAHRPVLMTNLAAVLVGFGMMAQAIVVPQLLQVPTATGYGLGRSLLETGLWMAPGGLMMMFMAPLSGRLIDTIGAKYTLSIGAAVIGAGYLVGLGLMQEPWQLLVAMCVISAGVGIGYAAMPTLVLQNSPPRDAATAVGVNTLSRSIGTTIAGAVMATLLTSRTMSLGGTPLPTKGAFQACFVFGAVAAFAGSLLALAAAPRTPHDGPDRSGGRDRPAVSAAS